MGRCRPSPCRALQYERQSKNRPQNIAEAVFRGGVKVVHRRILVPRSLAFTTRFVGHRRDVFRGYLWSCTSSGIGGWSQSTGGGGRVWDFARFGSEDAALLGAAWLSAPAAD